MSSLNGRGVFNLIRNKSVQFECKCLPQAHVIQHLTWLLELFVGLQDLQELRQKDARVWVLKVTLLPVTAPGLSELLRCDVKKLFTLLWGNKLFTLLPPLWRFAFHKPGALNHFGRVLATATDRSGTQTTPQEAARFYISRKSTQGILMTPYP